MISTCKFCNVSSWKNDGNKGSLLCKHDHITTDDDACDTSVVTQCKAWLSPFTSPVTIMPWVCPCRVQNQAKAKRANIEIQRLKVRGSKVETDYWSDCTSLQSCTYFFCLISWCRSHLSFLAVSTSRREMGRTCCLKQLVHTDTCCLGLTVEQMHIYSCHTMRLCCSNQNRGSLPVQLTCKPSICRQILCVFVICIGLHGKQGRQIRATTQ